MTTTDTRAALEAAIDAYATAAIANAGAALTDAWAAIAWAAISSAITAHVAAEVARALACAPGVEEAIGDVTVAWWDEAIRQCGRKEGFVIDEPDDRTTSGVALRAAIAADKARAVDDLLAKLLAGAGIDEQDRPFLPPGEQVDAILRWAQRAGDAYRGVRNVHEQLHEAHKRIEWQHARPTPDEARRLVEAHHLDLLSIADAVASLHGATGPGLRGHCVAQADKLRLAASTARTALLRALGVEE